MADDQTTTSTFADLSIAAQGLSTVGDMQARLERYPHIVVTVAPRKR